MALDKFRQVDVLLNRANDYQLETQFVKEGARNGILKKDPDGGKMIDPDISHNQLSGVKQIATLSRSVIMTYFDGSSNYVKILKEGSGKFENELNAEDWSTFNL